MSNPKAPTTLGELYEILVNEPEDKNSGEQAEYGQAHGLPTKQGQIDMSDLPTFGGDEPDDTAEIWSWDENNLLVGSELEIVSRYDWFGE